MSKLIIIGVVLCTCALCWHVGARMTHGELNMALGIIFGVFIVGLPATLIAVAGSKKRVDIYHHTVTETPPQHTVQPTALVVQPEKWFVIEPTVMILPTATHGKLEVKR